ncbi:BTAD domain-containing putative transcriptional regulator [Streptosporangium sp. G11]|uniref:BTAD domain-containing putative transcriptional regulator n=1 Tax=Streptosporangium sp. G11 TaxID=3436926 RepID=UPI003EBDF841
MEFLVLGPLEIVHDGRSVAPSAAKDRAFLGELLAHPGRLITNEHLADVLWQDRLPANPANAVQVRASRLRATLRSIARAEVAGQVLVSRSGGYELNLDHAGTDVARFEETLSRGDALALREGLAIWRGKPFSDVPPTPCVEIQVARLEELRLSAMESYADLCLDEANVPATLVAELADEVARSPLRESLQFRLVRALHMIGRSAEALTVYERLRRTLADELGTDPRPELRRLHLEIVAEHGADVAGPSAPVTLLPERGNATAASEEHVAGLAPGSGPAPASGSGSGLGPGRVPPERTGASRRRLSPVTLAGLACLLGLGGAGGYWLLQEQARSGAPAGAVATGVPQQSPSPKRPIPGDSSRLDADVTYPDGSEVKVGERFVKTWKITNTGSVPWRGRRLARQPLQPGADGCDSPTSIPLRDTDPGQPVLINVSVEARSTPGRCKVYWKMIDAQGVPFMPHLSGIFFDVNVVP